MRAPRPGERSRNLDERLSQKARAAPARQRPRPVPGARDLSCATSRAPAPWMRTPAPARVRKQAEFSQEPTPQRAGAGPGFRACPRGREGPQGSPPRLSRRLGPAPAVLCPPCARDARARAAHSRGRPLPKAVLFLRLPSGHLAGNVQHPPVCDTRSAHSSTARARPLGSLVPSTAWNPGGMGLGCEDLLMSPWWARYRQPLLMGGNKSIKSRVTAKFVAV